MSCIAPIWSPVLLLLVFLAPAGQAHPDTPQRTLDSVAFQQRIGEQLPATVPFRNAAGEAVALAALAERGPLILVLSWFECPHLCPTLLDQLAEAAAGLPFAADEYRVAVISIDPRETAAQAGQLAQRLRDRHGQIVSGWQLLTGTLEAIDTLADAVGFQYAYDEARESYAHPAGLVVIAAGGTISRYLFRVNPRQPDLRLALLDAGRGELGSPVDQLLLRCYHFDPESGQYSVAVMRLLQVTGGLFLLALAGLILRMRDRGHT